MFYIQVNDFASWRKKARELLQRHVQPDAIVWQQDQQQSLLWAETENHLSLDIRAVNPSISPDFIDLAKSVACHRDEERWALLYSLAWRMMFEDRELLKFKIDPLVARLLAMHKSVSRDCHKMKAFVRFRKVAVCSKNLKAESRFTSEDDCEQGAETFVAWFEPDHFILERVAPFFRKRFNTMRWSILTPYACAHWDLHEMTFTEGLPRSPKIEDELEDLWRQYYSSIFNPARLKLKAMQSEMPKKYWVNLPEAPLIAELTQRSGSRMDNMVNEPQGKDWEKTQKSRYVKSRQQTLRSAREKAD